MGIFRQNSPEPSITAKKVLIVFRNKPIDKDETISISSLWCKECSSPNMEKHSCVDKIKGLKYAAARDAR